MQVNVLVEGQTEETFVKQILYNYLIPFDVFLIPTIISTKRIKSGQKFKGGLTDANFDQFLSDLRKIIYSTPQGFVTTFIDYYAIPSKFPGYDEKTIFSTQIEKVVFLENMLFESLGSPRNFIPYIQLHEFESLLFADENGFNSNISAKDPNLPKLHRIINSFPNPEDIDEGRDTAPSKRILKYYPGYDKVTEGNLILLNIGIERLLEKCPHFRSWVEKLEHLGKE